MRVRVRYFALMREEIGTGEEERDVPDGTTAGALFDAVTAGRPRLEGMRPATMLMVNEAYAPADRPLADGDEVAFIPPVSGGGGGVASPPDAGPAPLVRPFLVTAEPLDPRRVEATVAHPAAGAVVTFTGAVRDHARGRVVVALDYEAYAPAAEKLLAQVGDEIREKWGIERVAVAHRTGYLVPGEASVVIAVASAHRGEAFAACQYAIERLKEIVPIWKKEHYADGAVWVGSEAEYRRETSP